MADAEVHLERDMAIVVRAELRIAPGTREEFLKAATALTDAAAKEAGTLRYDWYTSDDPTEFVVIEEYADPDAALAHNQNCAVLLRRIGKVAETTSADLHGYLGPTLEAWVAERSFGHAYPPLR